MGEEWDYTVDKNPDLTAEEAAAIFETEIKEFLSGREWVKCCLCEVVLEVSTDSFCCVFNRHSNKVEVNCYDCNPPED